MKELHNKLIELYQKLDNINYKINNTSEFDRCSLINEKQDIITQIDVLERAKEILLKNN